METQTVKLIDPSRRVVATLRVADEGTFYGGTIDLHETPPSLCALFEEFEDIVNGQVFALLDDIQDRIKTLLLKAVFETGEEVNVKDLQVFPSGGDVSFRVSPTSQVTQRKKPASLPVGQDSDPDCATPLNTGWTQSGSES